MSYIIYKTTNTINGKYYIGVTNGNKPGYLGSGRALKDAIKEYGRENFVHETLEVFDTEEKAYLREGEIVNETFVADRDTYNIGRGGKGGPGQPKSKEHIKKIKKARAKQLNVGRKPAMDLEFLINNVKQYGIKDAADKLGLTFQQCRDRYYRAKRKYALVVE